MQETGETHEVYWVEFVSEFMDPTWVEFLSKFMDPPPNWLYLDSKMQRLELDLV